MMGNFVTINEKQCSFTSEVWFKLDNYVYLKEGSNNFLDLKKTLQNIVSKFDEISSEDSEVLVKTLMQFFIRNEGLPYILDKKGFWFNEYPIVILDKKDIDNPDDESLTCGYISCNTMNNPDIYKQIIKSVIKFGFEHYENTSKYGFNINKLTNELSTILNSNEYIHDYLFSFEVKELSKDEILIGENIVNLVEVPKLMDEIKGKFTNLHGLWSAKNINDDVMKNDVIMTSISYEKYLTDSVKFTTIIHEILHGIFYSYDINLLDIVEKNDKNPKVIEEVIVDRLSKYLATTILDNKTFVNNILGTLANSEVGTINDIIERNNIQNEKYITVVREKIKQEEREAAKAIELKEMLLEYKKLNKESRENTANTIAATKELEKLLNAENE